MKKEEKGATRRSGPGRLAGLLRNNRGEGNFGCVFTLILMAAAGYVAYLFVIPYYEYNAFESRVAEMVPYYRNHQSEYIHEAVMNISKEFDLKLKPEQVKVQVLGRQNRIIIDIEYTKTVELPFYTHTLTFRPHLTGTAY